MELDARRLRVLREVALRGTITAAAGTLGFTPSAVSQQLSALERESGTALLERTGRQVRLTDAGRLLVDRSEEDLLLAAPEGRFAQSPTMRRLASEVWAAEPPDSACGQAVRRACRAAGFEPDVRYDSRESGVLLAAVAAGAVAVLPRLGLAAVPTGVDVLPVKGLRMHRLAFAARRRGSPARPSASLMLDRLQAAARHLPGV